MKFISNQEHDVFDIRSVESLTKAWTIKESVFKAFGHSGIDFKKNIKIQSLKNDKALVVINKNEILEKLIIIISPFAPHLCEELWSIIGNSKSVSFANYPKFNSDYLIEDKYEYPLMINGKLRAKQSFSLNTEDSEIKNSVMENETIKKWLDGKKIKKIIIVPNKIINIVC